MNKHIDKGFLMLTYCMLIRHLEISEKLPTFAPKQKTELWEQTLRLIAKHKKLMNIYNFLKAYIGPVYAGFASLCSIVGHVF